MDEARTWTISSRQLLGSKNRIFVNERWEISKEISILLGGRDDDLGMVFVMNESSFSEFVNPEISYSYDRFFVKVIQ